MPDFKLQSIKGKKIFAQMYESGKRFSNGKAAAIVELCRQEEQQNPLLVSYAVICSKKTARKAVVRNRIKRLLRVSIRNLFATAQSDDLMLIGKIIVSWREAPSHPGMICLKDVEPVIEELFLKIEKHISHLRTKA